MAYLLLFVYLALAGELLVAACGIQFPDQGQNQVPALGAQEPQPLDHQGSPTSSYL